jgi:hypothetical protein
MTSTCQDISQKHIEKSMITLNSGIPTSTERNYNLEFCEELTNLIMGRAGEPLRLPDLLSVAKKIAGEELWLVEEAIWEFAKIPEVQLSEEEKAERRGKNPLPVWRAFVRAGT